MDNEVRPTWRLAWGLWWRWFLISLGICVIIGAILAILFLVCGVSWESCLGSCIGWLSGVF
jgi:hypothetical protein